VGSCRAQVTFSAFSGLFILQRAGLVDADWLTLLRLHVACELVACCCYCFWLLTALPFRWIFGAAIFFFGGAFLLQSAQMMRGIF